MRLLATFQLFLALSSLAAAADPPAGRGHQETLLGPFPQAAQASAVISPDVRHVAYVEKAEGGQRRRARRRAAEGIRPRGGNGLQSRRQDACLRGPTGRVVVRRRRPQRARPLPPRGRAVFSPDGARLAWVTLLEDQRRAVVVGGQSDRPCDMVFEGSLVFSNDGARLAYGAREGESWFLRVGQEQWGPYEFLGSTTGIRFSPQGKRLALAAQSSPSSSQSRQDDAAKPEKPSASGDSKTGSQAWQLVVDGAVLRAREPGRVGL